MAWCWGAASVSAGEPDRDVWLVSTRSIGCLDAAQVGPEDFDVRHYNAATGAWDAVKLDAVFEPNARPVWIWVHGNRVSWGQDRREGLAWDDTIRSQAPQARPFRLVIWSWPSDQIRGPLRDVRAKADRADREAGYLGWFLSRMPPRRSVRLVGFSYGSRIIGGALDRLEGQHRWEALLLAAATPHDWLLPGRPHGKTLDQVAHLYVMVNPCDRALRRFAMVDRCTRPCALGVAGLPGGLEEARMERVEERCGGDAGPVHDMWCYRSAGSTLAAVEAMWRTVDKNDTDRSVRKPVDQLDGAGRDRLVSGVGVGESSPR